MTDETGEKRTIAARGHCMYIETHKSHHNTDHPNWALHTQTKRLTTHDHHPRWQSYGPRDPRTASPGYVWTSQQPRPPRLRAPYLWLLELKSWFSAPQKSARTKTTPSYGLDPKPDDCPIQERHLFPILARHLIGHGGRRFWVSSQVTEGLERVTNPSESPHGSI